MLKTIMEKYTTEPAKIPLNDDIETIRNYFFLDGPTCLEIRKFA